MTWVAKLVLLPLVATIDLKKINLANRYLIMIKDTIFYHDDCSEN